MSCGRGSEEVFLPRPYGDEPFYGLLARYAASLGLPLHMSVARSVFGDARTTAVDLPTGLEVAAERCGRSIGLDAAGIVANLTLAPLYLAHLDGEAAAACRRAMCSRAATSLPNLLGIASSLVARPQRLRFCPRCVAEQRERLGECHWRRCHQVGGVLACADHHCLLVESNAPYRMGGDRHLFDAEDAIPHGSYLDEALRPARDSMVMVARRCREILDEAGPSPPTTSRHRWERAGTHRSRFRDIAAEFRSFFGVEDLQAIGCDVDPDQPQSWLCSMLTLSEARHHPIRHVLLDLFGEHVTCIKRRKLEAGPCADPVPKPADDEKLADAMLAWRGRAVRSMGKLDAEETLARRRLYEFLRRAAPEWLRAQRAYNGRPMNQRRIDWPERDARWEVSLREAASMLREEHPARRMSKSALVAAARLPIGTVSTLNHLPRCTATLKSLTEDVPAFECRKLRRAIADIIAVGRPVTAAEIRGLAKLTGPISGEARALIHTVSQPRQAAL